MLRGKIKGNSKSFSVQDGLFSCDDPQLQKQIREHIKMTIFGYCPTTRARNNRIGKFLESEYSATIEQWHESSSDASRPDGVMF